MDSNKKLKRIFALTLAAALLFICTAAAPVSGESDAAGRGSWTILAYMCGTDLESNGGLATQNIIQLLSLPPEDGLNVIAQTGGTEKRGFPAQFIRHKNSPRFHGTAS